MQSIRYRKKTIILINLLVLQGVLIAYNIFTTYRYNIGASQLGISRVIMAVSIAAMILSVLLVSEIVRLAEKENESELSALRLQESEQMVHVLRTHRHDFINHIQVIYGLAQIGRIDSLAKYVDELACGMEAESKLSRLAQPEVAALLIKKANIASLKGINFKVEVSTDLINVGIPAVDAVRIIGNLVDNAFYEVEKHSLAEKMVQVTLTEQPNWYVLTVCNNGPGIPEEIRNKIFEKGFSTKGSEGSGLGLYICRELVGQSRGSIILTSIMDFDTCFMVTLPYRNGQKK